VTSFRVAMASVFVFPALLSIGAACVLGGALAGWNPLWREPELTMSEAAALKDRATMQRLISKGVDPNVPASVRAGILKSRDIVVTPLEAPVGTRTPTAMQFLLARGARMDDRERAILFCLADLVGVTVALAAYASGYGFSVRNTDELAALFGDAPWKFYVYNIVCAALTVLLSEPRGGRVPVHAFRHRG